MAVADWCGGKVAREAKAVARSTFFWANRGEGDAKELYREVVSKAVRCRDPFLAVKRRWIVRRLAPDCARIELADLPREHDTVRLLQAMGWETANVHLGTATAPALLVDLVSRPDGWLTQTVEKMLADLHADWDSWKKTPPAKPRKTPAAGAKVLTVGAKKPVAGRRAGGCPGLKSRAANDGSPSGTRALAAYPSPALFGVVLRALGELRRAG